jgi:hypothetical protein
MPFSVSVSVARAFFSGARDVVINEFEYLTIYTQIKLPFRKCEKQPFCFKFLTRIQNLKEIQIDFEWVQNDISLINAILNELKHILIICFTNVFHFAICLRNLIIGNIESQYFD